MLQVHILGIGGDDPWPLRNKEQHGWIDGHLLEMPSRELFQAGAVVSLAWKNLSHLVS